MKYRADPNAEMKVEECTDEKTEFYLGNVRVPLHFAAIKGDIKMAQVLIDNGADVGAKASLAHCGKRTALYFAVETGNLEMVEFLLKNGANPNVKVIDSSGVANHPSYRNWCTPLHLAVKMGNLAMVELLLKYGANINAKVVGDVLFEEGSSYREYTPLHIAVTKWNLELVEFIVNEIVKLQVADKYLNQEDLQLKVKVIPYIKKEIFLHNHKPLIDILPQLGYDGDNTRDSVKTFLEENKDRFAVKSAGWHETFLGCLDYKDVKERHAPEQELQEFAELLVAQIKLNKQLSDAVKKRDSNRAIELIQEGADVNAPDGDRNTPIHLAAEAGYLDLVKLLFNHGAKINFSNKSHEMPVSMAAEKRFADVVEFFIENCAPANTSIDRKGLIHFAAEQGNCHLIEVLIKHKANVNVQDKDGNTPLHLAAKEGHLDLVELLCKHDAKINLRNKFNEAPVLMAAKKISTGKKRFTDVVEFLVKNGAPANTIIDCKEMIHFSAEQGECNLMEVLIKHGADINAKGFCGDTPLNAATRAKQLESVKFLLGRGADPNLKNIYAKTPLRHAVDIDLTAITEL